MKQKPGKYAFYGHKFYNAHMAVYRWGVVSKKSWGDCYGGRFYWGGFSRCNNCKMSYWSNNESVVLPRFCVSCVRFVSDLARPVYWDDDEEIPF